ncbi:MAG: methyltransferase family protein [Muribaculaceae bacterium]
MKRDYLINVLFGITFINLAVIGCRTIDFSATFVTALRLGAMVLNLLMAVALFSNRYSVSGPDVWRKPYWLGMIASNILVVQLVDAAHPLLSVATALLGVGLVITLFALIALGRSFAVTPMMGKIKTDKAYSLVRHPIYLGESVMVVACTLASSTPWAWAALALFALCTVLRINQEEALLRTSSTYLSYCQSTRYKLLPYIY